MNQNFNALRRIWFLIKADPVQQALWSGYLLLLLLSLFHPLWFLPAVSWGLFWMALSAFTERGRPACLSTPLTANFYAVRSWRGWQGIFQRPAEPLPCRDLILGLCREQVELPAALAPGQYRIVTHDTVIRRLERMDNARILTKKYAYTASMAPVYNAMTRKKCKRCPTPCRFYTAAKELRQFFFVIFQIT